MTPVTVITGASAGIGAELARVFAANGHALALVARREQRLEALAEEIAATGRPKPLVLPIDLAMPHAAAWIGRALAARALEPEYVVNNAGFGLVGRAAELDRDEQLDDDRSQHARADRFVARRSSTASAGIAAACSTSHRWRVFCRGRARRCTTPARPSCCRSARRCMSSSSRLASG